MFQFFGTFEFRKYLVFEARRSESNYLMVIPPGTEMFFNYDWLYTSPTAIQINSDVNVKINKTEKFFSVLDHVWQSLDILLEVAS